MATLNPSVHSPAVPYSSPTVKPLPLGAAALYFATTSLVFVILIHWGTPALVKRGVPEFTAFLWTFLTPLVLSLVAALVAYRLEGRPLTWAALSERFRLRRMTREDWLWTLGASLVCLVANQALWRLGRILATRGLIPLPGSIPAALDPTLQLEIPAYREMMGLGALGNWALIALIVAVMFFNTFGEEFWWRGYILPRQELAHGRRTWVVHFVLWTLFHVFEYWRWLDIVAVTLPISYISQRQQNTWPAIIIHGVVNVVGMMPLVLIVLGILA